MNHWREVCRLLLGRRWRVLAQAERPAAACTCFQCLCDVQYKVPEAVALEASRLCLGWSPYRTEGYVSL